eukprot:619731-Rhodomonas_salina.1
MGREDVWVGMCALKRDETRPPSHSTPPLHARFLPHTRPDQKKASSCAESSRLRGGGWETPGDGQDACAEGGVLRQERQPGDAHQGRGLRPEQRAYQVAQGHLRLRRSQ